MANDGKHTFFSTQHDANPHVIDDYLSNSSQLLHRTITFQKSSQSSKPSSSSAPSSATTTTTDTNSFRWPTRYLFPLSSLTPIHRWRSITKIGAGLVNLSNTCFMNSVLQALCYTPALNNYMTAHTHSRTCKIQDYCLFCALEVTICHMNRSSVYAPKSIAHNLRAISRTLRLGRQEDAQEFLRTMMEVLQKNTMDTYGK